MANDANARVQLGVIEGSNVNTIETMVGMIQTARQFEAQTRLMQTAESDDRARRPTCSACRARFRKTAS
jgi:flagellar basal-body rod protein FlgF